MTAGASKMWSGRFREPLDKTFEQWQRSFPFDWRLLPQEVAASKAHARTIAAAGILTGDELAKMTYGLDQVQSTNGEMLREAYPSTRRPQTPLWLSPLRDVVRLNPQRTFTTSLSFGSQS